MEMEAMLSEAFGRSAVHGEQDNVDDRLERNWDVDSNVEQDAPRHLTAEVHEHSKPDRKGKNEANDAEDNHAYGRRVNAAGRQVKGWLFAKLAEADGLFFFPERPVTFNLHTAQCDFVCVHPKVALDLPPEPWEGERNDDKNDREEGEYHKNAIEYLFFTVNAHLNLFLTLFLPFCVCVLFVQVIFGSGFLYFYY